MNTFSQYIVTNNHIYCILKPHFLSDLDLSLRSIDVTIVLFVRAACLIISPSELVMKLEPQNLILCLPLASVEHLFVTTTGVFTKKRLFIRIVISQFFSHFLSVIGRLFLEA